MSINTPQITPPRNHTRGGSIHTHPSTYDDDDDEDGIRLEIGFDSDFKVLENHKN